MIQLAMLFALGFLAAGLLALGVMPLVARRAERRARARLTRQMPLSLPEIAAERDQLRAGHAVALRQLEQRIERLSERNAVLLGETGRQSTRLIALEQRHHADTEAIASLQGECERTAADLRDSEATLGAEAVALHDAVSRADRHRDRFVDALARLEAAETLIADQRTVIAELETRLGSPPPRAIAEPVGSSRIGDDAVHLRAALGRLRAEYDFVRKDYDGMASEREKLRFRIDELLLRIEDLQEQVEEAGDTALQERQRAARHDKAIGTLTARVAARDEALAMVKRLLAEETTRRVAVEAAHDRMLADHATVSNDGSDAAPRDDPAALRRAITALAEDLVRVANAQPQAPEAAKRPAREGSAPSTGRRRERRRSADPGPSATR